jgi:hypothetical protein
MDEIGITINRNDSEGTILEGINANVTIEANNGEFQGKLGCYITHTQFEIIGKALSSFPSKIPDNYSFENNGELIDDGYYSYFKLDASSNKLGKCVITVYLKKNVLMTKLEGECRLSIMAEPWAIHRLGELLKEYSKLKYVSLVWSLNPDNDLLIENK